MSETDHRRDPCKRTTSSRFNKDQLSELKKRFKSGRYLKKGEKELIAKNIGVTMTAVENWFCWERRRQRQHLANEANNATEVTS